HFFNCLFDDVESQSGTDRLIRYTIEHVEYFVMEFRINPNAVVCNLYECLLFCLFNRNLNRWISFTDVEIPDCVRYQITEYHPKATSVRIYVWFSTYRPTDDYVCFLIAHKLKVGDCLF